MGADGRERSRGTTPELVKWICCRIFAGRMGLIPLFQCPRRWQSLRGAICGVLQTLFFRRKSVCVLGGTACISSGGYHLKIKIPFSECSALCPPPGVLV